MQPPRDPADRRYWPTRQGGTGQGFQGAGRRKEDHPYHYGTLSKDGTLHNAARVPSTHSMDAKELDRATKAAIRARGRLLALKSIDKLANDVETLDPTELVAAANAGLKAAGMTQPNKGQGVTVNIGQLHLAALQARKALSNGSGTAITLGHNDTVDATILDEVTPSKDMASNEIGDDYIPAT